MGARYDMEKSAVGSAWPWALWLVLAMAVYTLGLGGQYIPTNGDELVYIHIARLTAETGQWLPLASDLPNMRNTKPPLLFWQAMLAGDFGAWWNVWWNQSGSSRWSMAALRAPSLVYTFLIAAMVASATRWITRDTRRALLAACLYLAFFSTFRYGRPYLTSAPETFWLSLPMFALLWLATRPKPPSLSWMFVVLTGLAWGLGAAYKSFALIAPAGAALWCAANLAQPGFRAANWVKTGFQLAASAAIGVGVFGLWFVLDPDPAAVWKEFVVGENVGKMGDKVGYWHEAVFGGGSSMWAQGLAYMENAGLLAFVVLGAAWAGLPRVFAGRATVNVARQTWLNPPAAVWVLLAWLVVWLVVFTLPSQRSARYVIPAMPALAILLGLYWERIVRGWFLASAGLIVAATLVMARTNWVSHGLGISNTPEFAIAALGMLLTLATLTAALVRPDWTRTSVVAACLLFYGVFGLTTRPLDGPSGRYPQVVNTTPEGATHPTLAVPSNFNAQWERFEFLLPGSRIVPFDMAAMYAGEASKTTLERLLATHTAVVWGAAQPSDTAPPCVPRCTLLASRWVIKERHQTGDITWANLWSLSWLFSREWLVKAAP